MDLPLERVDQVGAGHGANRVGWVGGIADLQLSYRGGEPAGELVGDRPLHDEALGGEAALAAVDEA